MQISANEIKISRIKRKRKDKPSQMNSQMLVLVLVALISLTSVDCTREEVDNRQSQIDAEVNVMLATLLTDPEYLSLSGLEQYRVFNALYTIIMDKIRQRIYTSASIRGNIFDMTKRK